MLEFDDIILQLMALYNSWLWIVSALMIFTITLIGTHPLDYKHDATFKQRLAVSLRKVLLASILFLIAFVPILLYVAYSFVINLSGSISDFLHWYFRMIGHNWRPLLAAYLGAIILKVVHTRYLVPRISSLKRKYRVNLTSEKLSDIRDEKAKYRYKEFDPTKYYTSNEIFFGLDSFDQSVTVPLHDWLETNMQVIGPTRFGKGILLGCQIDQAILNGYCVFYIDPKGDQNLPHIMADRAKALGRDFIYCDLNDDGVGGWHPFSGGDLRAKRARLLMACGLEDTGNESDFYKINERSIVDELLQRNSKINGFLQVFEANKTKHYQEQAKRFYGKMVEWGKIKSLNPSGEGLSIEKSMLNNAVVYIKGSLDDSVVRDATRVLIVEIIQEAKRLENKRNSHLTVVIDEIRFLMSNQIADASATITGTNTNLILAYQSKTDLRNVNDVNIDARAAEASINTNCQLKFIYGTQDPDTGKWAEDMSGKLQKMVTLREMTEVGHMGEERWEGNRTVSHQDEAYITMNTMLSLEKRAGVLFQPSKLPQIIFTSYVKTSKDHIFDAQHYNKSTQSAMIKQSYDDEHLSPKVTVDEDNMKRRGITIDELG